MEGVLEEGERERERAKAMGGEREGEGAYRAAAARLTRTTGFAAATRAASSRTRWLGTRGHASSAMAVWATGTMEEGRGRLFEWRGTRDEYDGKVWV
jgi:hypothetical protein